MFILRKVVEQADNQADVTEIHLRRNKLKLPTEPKIMLLIISCSESKNCKDFLIALVKKIQEKCSLNYSLIRNALCLSPNNMISQKVSCISKFGKLCDKLFQFKHIYGIISDNA